MALALSMEMRPNDVVAPHRRDGFRFHLIDGKHNVRKRSSPGKLLLKKRMQMELLRDADLGRTDRMSFFYAWRRQMRELSSLEVGMLATEAYRWAMRRLSAEGLS